MKAPPPNKAEATNEELLRKVIKAQVKGGCKRWFNNLEEYGKLKLDVDEYGPKIGRFSLTDDGRLGEYEWAYGIIEILLDTDGCKAAYGEWGGMMANPTIKTGKYMAISIAILRAWHSDKGNNVRAALETAVSFLPKE